MCTATKPAHEGIWAEHERPYYNVWPIAIGLAKSVQLRLPFSAVRLPCEFSTETPRGVIRTTPLLFRFAKGHEPYGIETALLDWRHTSNELFVHGFASKDEGMFFWERYEPSESVEEWLDRLITRPKGYGANPGTLERSAGEEAGRAEIALLARLVVFVALLAKDEDVITPVVLSKDRAKHESTDDSDVKKWLEDRAARRAGRGFDVGRRLQTEKDASPHWRNPHLCLFWTGEGRQVPVIKMRSGTVIQRTSMADVPTGYFGPETEADERISLGKTPRKSISKSRRFAILKRDNYRCQLCGRSQKDGAKLHVDHRLPLAKGGPNEDDNLWTLCEDCNLGKSDQEL